MTYISYESHELYHHGILGQKWGVRRFQNPDGTLTEAGKKRLRKLENYKDKLINDYKKRSAKLYSLSLSKGYSQEYRSGFAKASDADKHAAAVMEDTDISVLASKKDIKKAMDFIAEQQYNSYYVAYKPDGDVEIINPSTYKSKSQAKKELKQTSDNGHEYSYELFNGEPEDYRTEYKSPIGKFKNVDIRIETTPGEENIAEETMNKIIKKYNSDKAVNGLANYHYDGDYRQDYREMLEQVGIHNKEDFKKKLNLDYVYYNNEDNVLTFWYRDPLGQHFMIDEADPENLKVKYRSMEG